MPEPSTLEALTGNPDNADGIAMRVPPDDDDALFHALSNTFSDMAVEARHRRCNRPLKRADQIAHVLGIEPRRQRRRADEIAEHHRQLTAFGSVLKFRLYQGGRLSRDRLESGTQRDRSQDSFATRREVESDAIKVMQKRISTWWVSE